MSSGPLKNKKLKVFHKTGLFTTHDQSSTSKLSVYQTSSASSSLQHQTTPPRSYHQSTPKAQSSQHPYPIPATKKRGSRKRNKTNDRIGYH